MYLIPYDRFTISTHLSPQGVADRLSPVVLETRSWGESIAASLDRPLRSMDDPKPPERLEGVIRPSGFKVHRVIYYRNSFLPIVSGRYLQRPDGGTDVHVSMRLHWFTLIFMVIWLSGTGAGSVAPIEKLIDRQPIEPILMMPVAMLVFGLVLTLGAFWPEAGKVRRFLKELLDDRPHISPS